MKAMTLDLGWINKLKLEDFDIRDSTWEAYHGSCQTYHQFTVQRKERLFFDPFKFDFDGKIKPTLKQIKARLKTLAVYKFVEQNQSELAGLIEASIGDAEPSKLTISINTSIY